MHPLFTHRTITNPVVSASLLDALAIVLPVTCAGCGLDDRALCGPCRGLLAAAPTVTTLVDGTAAGLAVHSALRYEGPVRRMILALKEQGRTDIARALSVSFGAVVRAGADHVGGDVPVELVAVPGSRAGYRRRGYDPVRLLVRRAGLPTPARLLVNTVDRVAQKSLDIDGRAISLVGSMRAAKDLTSRRILVVDDVLTTGATLVEATRALRAAGAEVVSASTLAYTPRYFPRVS